MESLIAAEALLLDFGKSLLEDRTKDALQKVLALVPEIGASSERFVFNKPCTGERKFCWMEFPLADAQAIRAVAGGTLNDVVLTVIARGVSKYIRLHGEPVDGTLSAGGLPVNVRRSDGGESLGNQISFLPVALPLDIRDPIAFVRAVSAQDGGHEELAGVALGGAARELDRRGAASAAAFVLADAARPSRCRCRCST